MSNEKELKIFRARIARISALLDELKTHVDNNMKINPNDVNREQVGDVGWLLEKVDELTDWALASY